LEKPVVHGLPLLRYYHIRFAKKYRTAANAFIIADMKILDTGNLEARMAADASADAVIVSGLAPIFYRQKPL